MTRDPPLPSEQDVSETDAGSSAPDSRPGSLRFRRAFLIVILVGITLLFAVMIRRLILSVFLAAIFAGMAYPLYSWLSTRLRLRPAVASGATIVVLLLGIAVPVGGFIAVVVNEAVQLAQAAEAWLTDPGERVEQLQALMARIPFTDRVVPEGEALALGLRDLAARAGSFAWGTVSGAARGTASFLLQLFVLVYALFFFLMSGPATLRGALAYLPLSPADKDRLLERFLSVARATLKGSFLIGVIQGGAAGLAFWVAGVPGAAFWGAVMVFLAILPALGAGLVWVPAVGYLLVVGRWLPAVLLAVWCALVVGTVDNLLRPRLIGRDARMGDLMIFLSTLGGIALFGAVGFIVGPIVAALFVTVWHIYGEAFQDWLPAAAVASASRETAPPHPSPPEPPEPVEPPEEVDPQTE